MATRAIVASRQAVRCSIWLGICSNALAPACAQAELDKQAAEHIEKFDDAGLNFFTNQQWERFAESHSKNVVVHWSDGHQTVGLPQHIDDLKAMFVFAPDTRINEHPIKIASGEWTSVVEVIEGTFTRPMPTPDGKSIPPTGKPFKVELSDIAHWKDGVMDQEYIFWDTLAFMRQIGIAQ
jgi:hypothetical protein